MDKKYTAFVLVVLLVAAEANTINAKSQLTPKLLDDNQKWEGLGITADLNAYMDKTISMVIPFIETHGLDPMGLPDVVEGFEVKVLLVTYSAWLKVHDGYMTGLVNIARSGDQQVHYFAKMIRLNIQLQFTDLEFVYKYLVQVMNLGPTGGIIGSLTRFVVNVDMLIDFNNDEIHLQNFSLTDIGRIRVRFTGNILFDWLLTPVVNVFLRILDNLIMTVVQSNIRSGIQDAIDVINSNVKDVIRTIESYN